MLITSLYMTPIALASQTHKFDTSVYHFKLDNDCRIKFNENYIYLGDTNGLFSWIDSDTIKFHNLRIDSSDCPSPWKVTLTGTANFTITELFESERLDVTVSASTGTVSTFKCYLGKFSVSSVSSNDVSLTESSSESALSDYANAYYVDSATSYLSVRTTHSSDNDIVVVLYEPSPSPGPGPGPTMITTFLSIETLKIYLPNEVVIIQGNLTDKDDRTLRYQTVTLKCSWLDYKNVTGTDDKGQYGFYPRAPSEKGIYNFTVYFEGATGYKESSLTETIQVGVEQPSDVFRDWFYSLPPAYIAGGIGLFIVAVFITWIWWGRRHD